MAQLPAPSRLGQGDLRPLAIKELREHGKSQTTCDSRWPESFSGPESRLLYIHDKGAQPGKGHPQWRPWQEAPAGVRLRNCLLENGVVRSSSRTRRVE